MQKVAVIGCGDFGYALALLLTETHEELNVKVFDVREEIVKELQEERRHPYNHCEHEAPDNLEASTDLEETLRGAELVIFAVPAQHMREAVKDARALLPSDAILLNVSKALEKDSDKRMSEVIREETSGENPIATLSGGMMADDVADGNPVGADVGCEDEEALKEIRELFKPTTVHVDTTTDIKGIEYGGAFKNVIAIGAGVVDGLRFGNSTKAFYISQALNEVEELAVELGAQHETFHTSSNSWIGDLMTTCYGDSRNRYFGRQIGKGMSKDEALTKLEEENKLAEGYVTLEVVHDLLEEKNVTSPFIDTLYQVVYEGRDAEEKFSKISLFQN